MMKRELILAIALCLLLALPVLAQVSANHKISWHVIAGGGGQMKGTGGHTLWSTVGQPLIGVSFNHRGILYSGFWYGSAVPYRSYLPLTMRNVP